MKSLQAFIEENLHIDLVSTDYLRLTASGALNGLDELLTTCFVIHNEHRIELPDIYPGARYKDIVDTCVIHLLKKKLYNNILTFGYRIAVSSEVNTSLHCVSTNSNVSRIKGKQWQLLCRIIGIENFVDLLMNYTVLQYIDKFFTQIVGNRANERHVPPSWCSDNRDASCGSHDVPITIQKLLYRNASPFNEEQVLPAGDDVEAIINEIFGPSSYSKLCFRKSKVIPIIKKMIQNHAGLKYLQILNSVCPFDSDFVEGKHLDASTKVTLVNKFVIIILQKLIPSEMFGSKRNKSKIFYYLSQLLRLPLKGTIPFSELKNSQRIEDFRWIRLVANCNESSLQNNQRLVACFISWIFKLIIPRIVTTFFYATEVSSSVLVLFFRHDAWSKISAPFMKDYVDKYLIENEVCRNHNSYLLSKYNHSRLRLVPKKAKGEFRVLAIPFKGADDEEYSIFQHNFKTMILPVQCILEYLRKKRKTHCRKLYSPTQIAKHLMRFKKVLLTKYGKIPDLFSMKFDIESCYDSISRKKAMQVIGVVLGNETGFFVRSQSFYQPETGILKIQNVVNGCRQPAEDEIYIDNVRTVYLSKEDVCDVLKMELFDTALCLAGKCYLRRDGLFQGSRLSALVVDLVYDDLMERYEIFRGQYPNESLSLRLADDFLVISTDRNQILELKKLSSDGFKEYGAKIKAEKIKISSSICLPHKPFQFCALNISLASLQAWKNSESFNIPYICFASTSKTYDQLIKLLEMRLSYGTTDSSLNTPFTILFQIHEVCVNVSQTFVGAFRKKIILLQPFENFILRLLVSTIKACQNCGCDPFFQSQLRQLVFQTFLETLLPIPSKFVEVIRYLKFELNKCTYISSVAPG
ncbi:EST2 (YLR318W) [Zygosaccharomyces parabailii]|uniref:Telomerase reverse transcriptase n=1 Tax=Zygosaccharomyces bailii (strain CLIB 213 / ATCC 58445 / CBS 680 / BCRC 21525 / NBRC 1098 / NCYC 1416 / NRRL Y-2227) TaxID=1333698 RepID=A0A8J2T3P0_ZYGB2|nr:EST2 (YLR318W) [Zygosaccharomyces parabailii]CDF87506.1 BN860_07932g1_1 [Zygosaccharomyces bailii CLIB 213]CDH09348.1 related to EST2-Catalytic subunit of the telomerase [Zygosaccharomyces bailii ISA1307]